MCGMEIITLFVIEVYSSNQFLSNFAFNQCCCRNA